MSYSYQNSRRPKVAVVFYSLYGHVKTLAYKIKEGIEAAGGDCVLLQVKETLPEEVLKKMHAPPKDSAIPIAEPDDLVNCDGVLFGFPTRFGMVPAQVKNLLDSTGQLWMKGALVGKPAGCFVSSGGQGSGQETTALTFLTQLTHHGMIFVPIGYSCQALFNMEESHGGSPYGAGTLAGAMGDRQPTAVELEIAKHQGTHFTKIVNALTIGKAAVEVGEAQYKQ